MAQTQTHVVKQRPRYSVWCDACERHVGTDLTGSAARRLEAEHVIREHGGK